MDEELLRSVRVVAARRGLSVSALLREQLKRLAEQDEQYESARAKALAWMEQGADLGASLPGARAELHERDALR